jgi:hypothetical protein
MNDTPNLPAEVAAPSPSAIAKAGMAPGGAIAALVPQSLDDAFRLSKALAMAGDMVPKHFQGKPEMTMAAIVRGMEIGLAPMQALSNIAVINGRASIWGDALPALLQRAGHSIDCVIEGEGENRLARATVKRGDTGETIVRTFSVADAKKANLWGKAGPWQSYPDRMLQMRARSFAARDGAADALMGLQVAEETSDYQPIKDVTPKTGGFADRAARARLPSEPAPEPQGSTPQGDVIDRQAQEPEAEDADAEAAFRALAAEGGPGSAAWDKGVTAFEDGQPITACSYDPDETKTDAEDWCAGWVNAERAKA